MEYITEILRCFGLSRRYKGLRYLLYILETSDITHSNLTAQELYMKTATYFGCSWRSVESALRTLANRAWTVNPSLLCEIAGAPLQSAPTSARFLKIICSYVKFLESSTCR